ncbi:MAG: DUF3880 domain-containing protein [Acinetobacter sp.]
MKHKILVIGKRGGILHWYENILDIDTANENFELYSFAVNHNNFKERTCKFFIKTLKNKTAYQHYTAKLLDKTINSIQPDIILIVDLFYFGTSILNVLDQAKSQYQTKIYHWIGDFFDDRLIQSKQTIDQYLFTDSTFIQDAHNLGITQCHYLPLATNPKIFKQTIPFQNKQDRLLFIGAYSQSRANIIQNITYPMTIIGKGWDSFKPNDHDVKIQPNNIPITAVATYYDQHKYIFNAINKNNTRQGLTMRCFDVPACGSILISEYSEDFKQVPYLQTEYTFTDVNEIHALIEKINTTSIPSHANDISEKEKLYYKSRIEAIISYTSVPIESDKKSYP